MRSSSTERPGWRRLPTLVSILAGLVLVAVAPAAASEAIEIAVTVDDLPSHGPLPAGSTRVGIAAEMIAALERHGVPRAYGFVNGAQLRDAPELDAVLRAWRGAGLPVGNHTFSHLDLTRVSAQAFVVDVERNEPLLARLSPGGARYFRYPYLHEGDALAKRDAVRRWLRDHHYRIAPVTVYFDDWVWNDAYGRCAVARQPAALARLQATFLHAALARLTSATALATRLFDRPVKHVLLLHMGAFDALMLDALLGAYRSAGAHFIPLEGAITDGAYALDPRLALDGERTFLEQLEQARSGSAPAPSAAAQEVAALCR